LEVGRVSYAADEHPPVVKVELRVPDARTGDPTTIIFSRGVEDPDRPGICATEPTQLQIAKTVREVLRFAMQHEIAESLFINGVPLDDPHPEEGRVTARFVMPLTPLGHGLTAQEWAQRCKEIARG
jgi:hypothetical protein